MHLLDTKHTVLISPADSKLIDSIEGYGISVERTVPNYALRDNEQLHADMQVLAINNTAFIAGNCTDICELIGSYFKKVVVCDKLQKDYPNNVGLNAALVGDKLLCKISALDKKVRNYCEENDIRLINVNQGYTKCSTLILNHNAIITADITIHRAAHKNAIKSLLISPGHINLQDAEYGFIGGCSGVIGDTVLFFGDIHKHPDCNNITAFIISENMDYICLTDTVLNDVGGLVTLN